MFQELAASGVSAVGNKVGKRTLDELVNKLLTVRKDTKLLKNEKNNIIADWIDNRIFG
jgi:hypothetical protein